MAGAARIPIIGGYGDLVQGGADVGEVYRGQAREKSGPFDRKDRSEAWCLNGASRSGRSKFFANADSATSEATKKKERDATFLSTSLFPHARFLHHVLQGPMSLIVGVYFLL